VKEAEERGRKLAREMEERLSSTISDYETHVDTLRGQLNRMENELQSHDHSMISRSHDSLWVRLGVNVWPGLCQVYQRLLSLHLQS
jgi:hypothetical protein